jgi:hypothetical protein
MHMSTNRKGGYNIFYIASLNHNYYLYDTYAYLLGCADFRERLHPIIFHVLCCFLRGQPATADFCFHFNMVLLYLAIQYNLLLFVTPMSISINLGTPLPPSSLHTQSHRQKTCNITLSLPETA